MVIKKSIVFIILILILCISVINPIYPNQMYLQHSATLLAFIFMILDIRKNYISFNAFLFFSIFIVLHIIGARWIYSMVPYEDWFNTLGLNFNSSRNHYDRFVHFSFGILFFPIVFELAERKIKRWKVSLITTWLFIQTFSMFYELFEWSLTMMVSEKEADNYNGQQGDEWDAHKDMALAMLGSIIMMIIYYLKKSGMLRNQSRH